MADLFESADASDTDRYWDELTTRIVVRAVTTGTGLGWLARSNARWAIGLAVVTASLVLAMTPRREAMTPLPQGWILAIAPNDAAFRTVALRDRPPAIGGLLLARSLAGERP